MIKEDKVLMKINSRNITSFISKGYNLTSNDKECFIYIKDLNSGSKVKVTAICDICMSENIISYSKYLLNKGRNNKNYYSCFGCKGPKCSSRSRATGCAKP
jgi:hypothetical protein